MSRLPLLAAALVSACASPPAPAPDAHVHDVTDAADVADAAHADVHADAPRDARRAPDVPSRCVGGAALPYPDGAEVAVGAPLPALRFETAEGAASTADFYAPCAERPRLLVVRVLAAWSGPSQHAAAHTRRLLDHPSASRLAVLDLLALGPDNLPATRADLAAWRRLYDAAPSAVAADPDYRLRSLYISAGELPLVALVDTRTMSVERVATRPSSVELAYQVAAALADMDGAAPPAAPRPALVDGHLTEDEWEMVQAMAPAPAAPPDPTNRVADDPRAARLGEALFNDTGLSAGGAVACATCHDARQGFADGRPRAVGAAAGDRNTPTVLGAASARWLFWDGRADTLWSQALGPVENPLEMASSRLAVARRIAERYADDYAAVFGAPPDLADAAAVDRVFANFGKSVAAFERTLRPPVTALDRYAMGDRSALTDTQKRGLALFFETGCAQCHHGPWLTDGSFHNVGMPTGRRDGAGDRGRADAVSQLTASPFRADGRFSDDPAAGARPGALREHPSLLGQFRTPTLRAAARTGPWGHGGTFRTLEEVVIHYAQGGMPDPPVVTAGERDLHLPIFHRNEATIERLTAILRAMGE